MYSISFHNLATDIALAISGSSLALLTLERHRAGQSDSDPFQKLRFVFLSVLRRLRGNKPSPPLEGYISRRYRLFARYRALSVIGRRYGFRAVPIGFAIPTSVSPVLN